MKPATPQSPRHYYSRMHQWSTSGWMTPAILAVLSLALVLGSFEHTRGNLHRIREHVVTPDAAPASTGPGGQDPVVLKRQRNMTDGQPEFVSATLLPGRGFNLWQLTAFLPGHGEVPLLVSPPVRDAASLLNGTGPDANGSASTNYGGAFLAPWASQLQGGPSAAPGFLQTQWQGNRLEFPSMSTGSSLSTEGLLLARPADAVQTRVIPDGQSAQATFHAGSFAGGWPGNTELTVTTELSGHSVILTMSAQNISTVAEPFAMGWHPYFAIPSGHREDATLVVPSNNRISPPDRGTGLSSGAILSTFNTPYEFFRAGGTKLGDISLDETYVDLHSGILADDPIAELHDPAFNYGLRITPLSSNIRNFRVIAPAGKPWVSIGPNMNVPDPFGHEWDQLDSSGVVILQPGDTAVWKVRLEIFALDHSIIGLPVE
jgi:aldose 1-epimerase